MPEMDVEYEGSTTVEFYVYCSCGKGLCGQSTVSNQNIPFVTVEPCEDCLEEKRIEGYDEGHKEAERDRENES